MPQRKTTPTVISFFAVFTTHAAFIALVGFFSNALIHFVPSCQDTCTQFVNVLDPLLVDLLLHYRPHFVVDRI